MKFVVLVKMADGGPKPADQGGALGPGCEMALQTGLALREEGDEVVAVSLSTEKALPALQHCLDKGVDRAFLLADPRFQGSDSLAGARIVHRLLEKEVPDFDFILTGGRTDGGDPGQLQAQLGTLLGIEPVLQTKKVSREGDSILATQDYGNELRELSVSGRGLFSFFRPEGPPAPLPDREGVSIKPVVMCMDDLGLAENEVGRQGSGCRMLRTMPLSQRRRAEIVEGDAAAMAARVLEAGGWA